MNYNLQKSLLENNNFQILNNYEVLNNGKSLLISKKIESYFDDLVKVPDTIQVGGNKDFTFSKFYSEYIEHNILLLFIILCLVIFLIIKYINKNYYNNNLENYENNAIYPKQQKYTKTPKINFIDENDTDDTNNSYYDNDEDNNEDFEEDPRKIKQKLQKLKLLKIKKETERAKHLIELEKQSIMDIIDELSNINYKKIQNNNHIINNTNINTNKFNSNNANNFYKNYSNNDIYIDRDYLSENQSNFSQYSLIESNDIGHANDFYTINRNINYKDKKSPNYIKGMYIESPFEE